MSQRQGDAIRAWWATRFASGEVQKWTPERRKERARVKAIENGSRKRKNVDPAIQRARYAENRDKILAARKLKYAENIEMHRQRDRERRVANREASRANDRARYASNREKNLAGQKVWREKNRERVRANARRRDALKAATSVGPVDYRRVMAESGGLCGICGDVVDVTNPKAYHYDHRIPLSRGGGHVQDNIQLAHAKCNMQKHARVA